MLEVTGIYKSYGSMFSRIRSPVLKNISFNVRPGQCVALIGESGSGKSTLARLLLGLESFDSGAINCMGIAVTAKGRNRKALYRNMQPVFQDSAGCLNPRMKVQDILSEPLFNYTKQPWDKVDEAAKRLLAQVELPTDILLRYPHELSGGQQRRVCIARAISISPRFLILDEATAGIDATITKGILELLIRLQRDTGCGYLFITHDLNIALYMAEKIMVMQNGEILETVSGAKSANDFTEAYAKKLFISSPLRCLKENNLEDLK